MTNSIWLSANSRLMVRILFRFLTVMFATASISFKRSFDIRIETMVVSPAYFLGVIRNMGLSMKIYQQPTDIQEFACFLRDCLVVELSWPSAA